MIHGNDKAAKITGTALPETPASYHCRRNEALDMYCDYFIRY